MNTGTFFCYGMKLGWDHENTTRTYLGPLASNLNTSFQSHFQLIGMPIARKKLVLINIYSALNSSAVVINMSHLDRNYSVLKAQTFILFGK